MRAGNRMSFSNHAKDSEHYSHDLRINTYTAGVFLVMIGANIMNRIQTWILLLGILNYSLS